MPHTFFLVPGYGAQGGKAATSRDVRRRRLRCIVNSSRGIIGAWRKSEEYREDMSADDALDLVARCARKAAQDMRDDLRVNVYR